METMLIANKKKNGLRRKIFLLCFVLVFATAIAASVLIFQYVYELMRVMNETDDKQLELVEEQTALSLSVTQKTLFLSTTDTLAANFEGEIWTAKHDMETLAEQVRDVFEHPENYVEKDVLPPQKENADKFALQLTMPEGTDPEKAASDPMVRKLANLEPIMKRVVSGNNEYVMDCFIELPNGLSLAMDDRSAQKILPDGSVTPYDPLEQDWYQKTVESDGFFLSPLMHSHFYDLDEVVLGIPVVVDGETVAVIQSSMIYDKLKEIIDKVGTGSSIPVIVDREGRIVFSTKTEGELAIDGPNAADIRESDNEGLVELFNAADEARDIPYSAYYEATVDGKLYGVGYITMETSQWTLFVFEEEKKFEEFGQLVVDRMKEIMNEAGSMYSQIFVRFVLVAAVVMLIMVAAAYFASRHYSGRIVNPINTMTEQVDGAVDREFDFEMKDVYRTGDEVEVLADAFCQLTEKTKGYIRDLMDVTAAKERLDTELDVATRIQADMMPDDFSQINSNQSVSLYAAMDPAREVGGDFYDFFMIDEDHLCLIMADVSNKGVPAALFAAQSKMLLRNRALMGGTPGEILKDVNNSLCEGNKETMFVTVWLAILELSTGEMTEANGGHEDLVIRRASGQYEIHHTRHDFVLGGLEDMDYNNDSLVLEKGDAIFMYTDGLPEAMNAEGNLMGAERMLGILNENVTDTPEELLDHVRSAVKEYVGTAPQSDDLTMMMLERK